MNNKHAKKLTHLDFESNRNITPSQKKFNQVFSHSLLEYILTLSASAQNKKRPALDRPPLLRLEICL